MITRDDYFKRRDVEYAADMTPEIETNSVVTIAKANELLERAGMRRGCNSGWRPPAVNASIRGAAKKSKHMLGLAIDITDDDDSLDAWCVINQDVLEELGLWLESP